MLKFFSKIFGGREIKTTTIPISSGSFLDFALSGGGRVSASSAMGFYQKNSAVATAVDMIADSFEQIVPVLQDSEGNFIKDHEVISLLRRPNGFQTWGEMAGQISRHYLLKHDSHLSALGNVNRPPIEMFSVKPQNVSTIENTADSFPSAYMVTFGSGRGSYQRNESLKAGAKFYDGNLKELYHIMGFSSRVSNVEGDSPLEAAALEAKQQIEGRTHNLQMIRNGGRLSLVFSFKDVDRINDDEHQERKQRVNEQLGGALNAGKIAVTSGPEVDIREFGTNNKDMDYAELDKVASFAIYLRYKIPLPLVSTSASTFNNMENAVLQLYDNAVLPHADTLFAGMSKMLLPRYGLDPAKFRITYDPENITALMSRRLDQIERRKKTGIETINELRDLLPNRDDVAGGDVIYQPINLVPVGEDLFANEDDESKANDLLKRDGIEQ